MAATTYLRNALFNHVLRATPYTGPAVVYVALHTGDPGATGGSNELASGGYARQAVTLGAPTAGAGSNSGAVVFGPAPSAWTAVTHFSIWDAVSGGNALAYGTLDSSRTAATGETLRFAIGDLDAAIV